MRSSTFYDGVRSAWVPVLIGVVAWGLTGWLVFGYERPAPAPVRGVPECYVMGGMVEWNVAKTHQINRLLCVGVEDDYPYAIRVSRDEWEKWTQTLGRVWPGD